MVIRVNINKIVGNDDSLEPNLFKFQEINLNKSKILAGSKNNINVKAIKFLTINAIISFTN